MLASGLITPYPPSHGPLFEKISKHGALVTEAPDDAVMAGFRFLHRNRLIAEVKMNEDESVESFEYVWLDK